MKRFEVGKVYRANDSGNDPLRIVKRTARTIVVKNVSSGESWRMFLREDAKKGTEYVVDSTNVGTRWEYELTYRADLEVCAV